MNVIDDSIGMVDDETPLGHEIDGGNDHVADEVYKGWPGDGSGMDDFEDFNQRESEDYWNE